ncbi:aminotransferase class III-fold pyridoxal phosphate-dependent enzyme, partial [bacterium]
THATTFGGNPRCAAAALAAMEAMEEENIIGNCREMGKHLLGKLEKIAESSPRAKNARGRGLLIGLELAGGISPATIVSAMMAKGFLIGSAGESVLRFAPPLIVTKDQIDLLADALSSALDSL